jgi:signal transduction histidine kinase/CheY-like chemotaxis protein
MYGLVAALSAVTLLLVSWLALQRARAEHAAVARLRSETEQRVKAEERLRQAQKMESLGQLTGGIAHDFNNLLAVILGNLDLVRKRLTAADPRVKRLLDSAIQGAERGAALTQRLLAFARRQDLTPQVVEVPRLVAEMKELLNRSLGPAIRISIGFPPDLPPVRIDPNQFELALLNLAVNARDAMPLGGTITLSARVEIVKPADASGLAPGRYVCVSLADTGVGMDAATLAQAVEPFFTTKGVGKGTGLGLSMIHGFAVQSGGTLKLASKPGVGTSAELWLPEGERLAAAVPVQQPAQASQRTCKVLLVDDDSLVLTGTAAMLEDLGHVVVEAASGEDALNALDANAGIDLVITDYAMPGMNGLELTDRIRERLPELPVLLATGQAELPERVQLNLVRLNKPFRQEDLANAIAEIVTPSCEPTNLVHFPRRHAGE